MALVRGEQFVIGQHLGVAGRVIRLLVGGLSSFTGVTWLLPNLYQWRLMAAVLAGTVLFYALLHRLALWRPVARHPWLSTFLMLAPLGLLGFESGAAGGPHDRVRRALTA